MMMNFMRKCFSTCQTKLLMEKIKMYHHAEEDICVYLFTVIIHKRRIVFNLHCISDK